MNPLERQSGHLSDSGSSQPSNLHAAAVAANLARRELLLLQLAAVLFIVSLPYR